MGSTIPKLNANIARLRTAALGKILRLPSLSDLGTKKADCFMGRCSLNNGADDGLMNETVLKNSRIWARRAFRSLLSHSRWRLQPNTANKDVRRTYVSDLWGIVLALEPRRRSYHVRWPPSALRETWDRNSNFVYSKFDQPIPRYVCNIAAGTCYKEDCNATD